MPPKPKFTREEVVMGAVAVARKKGIEGVTARDVAAELGVSTRPIFTYFDTMEQVRDEVCAYAGELFREYSRRGLASGIPFRGFGHSLIAFAREEKELYRLLFFSREDRGGGKSLMDAPMEMAVPSIMEFYRMSEAEARHFFRNMWVCISSLADSIVTGACPYSDEELFAMMGELSYCFCAALKAHPELCGDSWDTDAAFRALLGRG